MWAGLLARLLAFKSSGDEVKVSGKGNMAMMCSSMSITSSPIPGIDSLT